MFGPRVDRLVGHAAPPFTLPDQAGEPVELAAFRGARRVIVAFYPEDDTPG